MNHGRTRLYRAAAVVALWVLAGGDSAAQPQQVVERVDVARVIIDVRVVDNRGRPVLNLEPGDFEVRIGGEPVRVESAQWYGDDAPSDGRAGEPIPSTGVTGFLEPGYRGQLIVFVVQKSLYPQRVVGLMRLLQHSERLLQRVMPRDRVAVLSFDSHLKIWLDFTDDLDQVRAVLADEVLFQSPPVPGVCAAGISCQQDSQRARQGALARPDGRMEPRDGVSLLATLSQETGRRTYEIQEALRRLGNALEPLPGAKSVVLVGYGFGQFTVTLGMIGATLDQRYEEARTALEAARAAVFSLDVTQADYHTFEHGLEAVAEDTGGLFARTYLHPWRAVDRVSSAVAGHYVLFTERPDVEPGSHPIEVDVAGHDGAVLARSTYVE